MSNNNLRLWQDASNELNIFYAKVGTTDYLQVKDLFEKKKKLREDEDYNKMTDSQKLWKDCCKTLGHKYVSKGTPEYLNVLELYKEISTLRSKN
jgi:hypothetical protein